MDERRQGKFLYSTKGKQLVQGMAQQITGGGNEITPLQQGIIGHRGYVETKNKGKNKWLNLKNEQIELQRNSNIEQKVHNMKVAAKITMSIG